MDKCHLVAEGLGRIVDDGNLYARAMAISRQTHATTDTKAEKETPIANTGKNERRVRS